MPFIHLRTQTGVDFMCNSSNIAQISSDGEAVVLTLQQAFEKVAKPSVDSANMAGKRVPRDESFLVAIKRDQEHTSPQKHFRLYADLKLSDEGLQKQIQEVASYIDGGLNNGQPIDLRDACEVRKNPRPSA